MHYDDQTRPFNLVSGLLLGGALGIGLTLLLVPTRSGALTLPGLLSARPGARRRAGAGKALRRSLQRVAGLRPRGWVG